MWLEDAFEKTHYADSNSKKYLYAVSYTIVLKEDLTFHYLVSELQEPFMKKQMFHSFGISFLVVLIL